jgi:hypothetical protein
MATPIWIKILLSGSNINKTWTHKEIQEMIYNGLGIDGSTVIPSHRDRIDMVFTTERLEKMDEDEFYNYFTDDPEVMDEDEPKSSFKETNKKMKAIEENPKEPVDVVSKMRDVVTKGLTYENYLKSATPKSSFKDTNKKMKEIEKNG